MSFKHWPSDMLSPASSQMSFFFLYATSRAHIKELENNPDFMFRAEVGNICEAPYAAGQRVIDNLDTILSSKTLASASKETLQTTFLVIVGVILAPSYTTGSGYSSLLGELNGSSTSLWGAMREHMCEMLAHYLIVVTAKLQIKFQHDFQRALIKSAPSRWEKKGRFAWVEYCSPSSTNFAEALLRMNRCVAVDTNDWFPTSWESSKAKANPFGFSTESDFCRIPTASDRSAFDPAWGKTRPSWERHEGTASQTDRLPWGEDWTSPSKETLSLDAHGCDLDIQMSVGCGGGEGRHQTDYARDLVWGTCRSFQPPDPPNLSLSMSGSVSMVGSPDRPACHRGDEECRGWC